MQQPAAQIGEIVKHPVGQISQQAVDQMPNFLTYIPWEHHLQIVTKCNNIEEDMFYIKETNFYGWSRTN